MSTADTRDLNASLRRVAKAVRYAASKARRPRQKARTAIRIKATPKQRAMFDALFVHGMRFAVVPGARGGFEIWDTRTDKLIGTRQDEAMAHELARKMQP